MKKILSILLLFVASIAAAQPTYTQLKSMQPSVGNGSVIITAPGTGALIGVQTYTPSLPPSIITGTAIVSTGTYSNPSWLTSLPLSKITGTNTLLPSTTSITINGSTQSLSVNPTFTVGEVISVTGSLVDNTDPLNPVIDLTTAITDGYLPVSSSGTFTESLISQNSNSVIINPTTGSDPYLIIRGPAGTNTSNLKFERNGGSAAGSIQGTAFGLTFNGTSSINNAGSLVFPTTQGIQSAGTLSITGSPINYTSGSAHTFTGTSMTYNGNQVATTNQLPIVTGGTGVTVSGTTPNYTISATTPTLSVVNAALSGSYPTQTLTIPTQTTQITAPTQTILTNNTTIATTAYVDIKTPFITPEMFGAVGDGSTNDLTALQSCVATATASGYKILLGQKNYRIAGSWQIPSNVHIQGGGYNSIISSTTNTFVINITGSNNYFKDFRVLGGAADAGSGGVQYGIYTAGNAGFTNYYLQNTIQGCYFENLKIGVATQSVIGTSSGTNHEGSFKISDCFFNNCETGFYALTRGEYNTLSNVNVFSCTFGLALVGGNNNVVGGQITDCGTGIVFGSATNDTHCGMTGTKINHCTTAVTGGHALNWNFTNCQFFAGSITLNSVGKTSFVGCEFSMSANTMSINTSPAFFYDCEFASLPGTYSLTSTAPVMKNCYNGTSKLYTPLLAYSEVTTSTLDFASTAAGAATDMTVTVTGAVLSDPISLGVPNGSTVANGDFSAWVSAAGVVTVRFVNTNLVTALDPASGSFKIHLFKP